MDLKLSENELDVLKFLNKSTDEVSYSELYENGVLIRSDSKTLLNLTTNDLIKCSISSTAFFPESVKCLSITDKGKEFLKSQPDK